MKYRDMLKAYKNGELPEKLKQEIEKDIEKQEAISEYLVDEMEEQWEVEETISLPEKEADENVKMINRSIRKAFIKLGVTVTAICMALILFVVFLLPPLVSKFYYDPSEIVVKGKDENYILNRISLDYMTYSALRLPGYYRDNVTAIAKGYGNYDIQINQNISLNDRFTNVGGYVNRNQLTLFDTNLLKVPSPNMFAGYGMDAKGKLEDRIKEESKGLEKNENLCHWYYTTTENAEDALKELDDNQMYVGYVTFNKMMDFSELMKIVAQISEVNTPEWYGVNVSERSNERLGIALLNGGSVAEEWKLKEYPYLNPQSIDGHVNDEKLMEKHLLDMLDYLSKQKEFLEMMGESSELYTGAADYIRKNGMTFYGLAVIGKKEDLLKIAAMNQVYGVCPQTLR